MRQTFHAAGKLLISGEYFVLDGALSLAIPTQMGQTLEVEDFQAGQIDWKSYTYEGGLWFEEVFAFEEDKILVQSTKNPEVAERLSQLFLSMAKQNPEWKNQILKKGAHVITKIQFPRLWGLGTSSTLIANLANWSTSNPYRLLGDSFGGSGYDIACAMSKGPILYQKINNEPQRVGIPLDLPFKQHLYFVYLGKKQNSREGINRYRERKNLIGQDKLKFISQLTLRMIQAKKLTSWNELVEKHEYIV
ncbi:MAG: GYDIA family GHMP kinase, partial [Bacteroidota bacterium]